MTGDGGGDTTIYRKTELKNIINVNGETVTSFAVTKDGLVYSFGSNNKNCLGRTGTATPALVVGLKDIVTIKTYSNHVIALSKHGEM